MDSTPPSLPSTRSYVHESDEYFQHVCDICIEDDRRLEANAFCAECLQYLCSACHKTHTRVSATKHHKLLTGKDLPAAKNNLPLPCKLHADNISKYFCYEHNVAYCTTCKKLNHRNCNPIATIDELCSNDNNKAETELKIDSLQRLLDEMKRLKKVTEVQITDLKSQKLDVILTVQNTRKQIVRYLDELETTILKKIDVEVAAGLAALDRQRKDLNGIIHALNKQTNDCKDLLEKGSVAQVVVMSAMLDADLRKYNGILEEGCENVFIPNVHFRVEGCIQDIKEHITSLGEIELIKSRAGTRRSYKDRNVVYLGKFDLNLPSDTDISLATAVIVMPNESILVCDANNEKIKLFHQDNKTMSELELSSMPTGMALLTPDCLIVTLPCEVCLQRIKIKDKRRLILDIKTETNLICNLPIIYQNDLIVLAKDDSYRYWNIIDTRGKFKRCIRKESIEEGIFSSLYHQHLSPDNKIIYLTDKYNGCFGISVTTGDIVLNYKDENIRCSDGVCTDPEGFIYIAGYESDNIVMINKNGGKQKDIVSLKDMRPAYITYSESINKLFVKSGDKLILFSLV